MGNDKNFTQEQKIILDQVAKSAYLSEDFYFTGGTALSSIYLQHRLSDDLDFFSVQRFNGQAILALMQEWSSKYNFSFKAESFEVVYIFRLVFENNESLKVDFSYYPYKNLKDFQIRGNLKIDSLTDIAVNKLLTISQRTEVKDFVDLFFLLKQFSLWDLIEGVRIKFKMELEPFILASDFLKVNNFHTLPKMIQPLKLEELKAFFRENAKKLGLQSVE